ncbi:hypothetical protein [Streptomyces capillispiralis]|uniref:HNH endonuclease n=1 Tax=Streptomyces capillispiralis TaxID=68182 RepID=A0A561TJN7_9ACTN|nr:hypothetical protein [Streptomyces capillispiralis]TWF87254.1 hypothetical protein FHX78_114258 [Streptomyces capillispiralis]GHH92824.1 hypothetical protein GCM10017779_32810 [Streptomyces capillispiralis]
MTLPSWQMKTDGNRKVGSMARAALWLLTEVGEGNIFTKAELRSAFSDVAQIDRRIRQLRDYGWRIDVSREDPSLKQDEQRFVSRGADVWIRGQAKTPKHKNSLTAAQRQKVFQADSYLCRSCGIAAGEEYGDDDVTQSVLNIARRKVVLADGSEEYQFVTECKRCGSGSADREVNLGALLELVEDLSPMERRILAGWVAADQRSPEPIERLWGLYRTLPEEARKAVADALGDADAADGKND